MNQYTFLYNRFLAKQKLFEQSDVDFFRYDDIFGQKIFEESFLTDGVHLVDELKQVLAEFVAEIHTYDSRKPAFFLSSNPSWETWVESMIERAKTLKKGTEQPHTSTPKPGNSSAPPSGRQPNLLIKAHPKPTRRRRNLTLRRQTLARPLPLMMRKARHPISDQLLAGAPLVRTQTPVSLKTILNRL